MGSSAATFGFFMSIGSVSLPVIEAFLQPFSHTQHDSRRARLRIVAAPRRVMHCPSSRPANAQVIRTDSPHGLPADYAQQRQARLLAESPLRRAWARREVVEVRAKEVAW